MPVLVDRLRRWLPRSYVARYRRVAGDGLAQWHAWRAIMAANYLDVSVEEERPGLIAIVSRSLRRRECRRAEA